MDVSMWMLVVVGYALAAWLLSALGAHIFEEGRMVSWLERFRHWMRNWWDNTDELPSLIVHTPGTVGGRARLDGSRMPVWCLELMRRGGRSIAELLEDYPHLTEEQIQAAWDYADAHGQEIEQDIRNQAMHDFHVDD
jgi:uncharacterized protein (DUF433 family)